MGRKAKIVLTTLLVIVVVGFWVYWFHVRDKQIDKLKSHYVLVPSAYITSFVNNRNLVTAFYSFYFRGKTYSGARAMGGIESTYESLFLGRTFPAMVDTTDPTNNAILITPFHFGKMGWRYPDSLKWVLRYYTWTGGSW